MAELLIVDDDADVADLLADALAALGHGVRLGRNGAEGLRLVAEKRPDVLLLDVEMPILTGPEMAYRMLVRNCGDEKVPIVLVSGAVNLLRIVNEIGTPYFLGKPYTLDSVLGVVQRALSERTPPHATQGVVS